MEFSFGFGRSTLPPSIPTPPPGGVDQLTCLTLGCFALLGAINFFFCLPAIRTIDTLGRRKWLTITLPFMAVFLAAAALSFRITDKGVRTGIVAMWLFREFRCGLNTPDALS